MRVATTPAKTMEGMLAKIALIASGYTEDDLDGIYDGILASAALDAQALAKAGGVGNGLGAPNVRRERGCFRAALSFVGLCDLFLIACLIRKFDASRSS